MEEDIVLKIKEQESLEVVKIICMLFGVFLFILGAILNYEETIIEVCFMWVFALIIEVVNYGEFIVSEKGIKCKRTGYIQYKQIYRMELKNRNLILYTRKDKKPYLITFAKNEDYMQIEKVYKYIDSKIRRVEDYKVDYKSIEEKISK